MILFFAVSCRNGDDNPQKIDQVVQIYIDSLGVDMLNTKLSGTYNTVEMKDIGGIYDQTAVSYNLKKDKDTINYIEYVSGATRNLKTNTSETQKVYESSMVLRLTKTVNKTLKTTIDTMKIEYSWTPENFQISKIYYDKKLMTITKTSEPANIIKIVK